jgi:Tol biopolymer transport system component
MPAGEKIAYRTGKGHDWVIRLMNPDGTDRVQLTRWLGQKEELHSEPEWSPDGTTLIFRRGDPIWSIRYDGTDERLLNADVRRYVRSQMTWSPDGSKIAYVNVAPDTADLWTGLSHTVWVMEADGSNPRVLVYRDSIAVDAVWGAR